MARNRKGQFVKTHRKSSGRRRSSSTALVVAAPRTVTRTRTRTVHVARRRRHGGGGGGGALGGEGKAALKTDAMLAGAGAILGYFETQKADTYAKIPTIAGIPKEVVIGGVLHLFRHKSKLARIGAAAAFTVAGYKFGVADFKLSGDE